MNMRGRKILLAIENDDGKIIGKVPITTEWTLEAEKLARDIYGTDINEAMVDALHSQIVKSIDKRTIEELLGEIRK